MKVIKNGPPPTPPPTYDIVGLTQFEMDVLNEILQRIGGSPDLGSPRDAVGRLIDSIYDSGYQPERTIPVNEALGRAIYFR